MDVEKRCVKSIGCVSALGLGTSSLGSSETDMAILGNALAYGLWLIDTSEVYGRGQVEELIGRALKSFAKHERENAVVVTKFWPDEQSFDKVVKAAEASSRRLGTYIDIYMPHGPIETARLCEVVKAFEELIERGVIRHWGLSIARRELIESARQCAKKYDIAAVENIYNPYHRIDEYGLIPYAQKEGVLYIAASPLARGLIVENRRLAQLAARLGKTPAQIALRWAMDKGVVPIPRTNRPDRVIEYAGAYGWRLPEDAVKFLEE
ncbi:MAG: aldo/keto reductase [Thermoproteus sp. AZ2]|jgi:diketogulonate reductase-like aldo/keto reductase|uniref:Aldo/keto reductase n=1 Tax=Thermoproteus sp. AZ2 TaxID=1609232 RepID=A0ACC6UZE3_9CREN|nr:MAG: aldo/keto reductase [Thermoproteus sp. AZ2]